MREILLKTGKIISLTEWQAQKGLNQVQVSQNIYTDKDNVLCDNTMLLSENIIEVFERARQTEKRPRHINSGYRNQAKQESLIISGARAAKTSPHVYGMAIDIQCDGQKDAITYRALFRILRDSYYPWLRIGSATYWNDGIWILHIDDAPYWFSGRTGHPRAPVSIPDQWRIQGLEW